MDGLARWRMQIEHRGLGGSKLTPYDQLDRLWLYEFPLPGPWLHVAEELHEFFCCFETKKFCEELEPGERFETFLVGTQENPASCGTPPVYFEKATFPYLRLAIDSGNWFLLSAGFGGAMLVGVLCLCFFGPAY
jgi:hypothetical protein